MLAAIPKITFVFAFAAHLVQGQVTDVAGEWRVENHRAIFTLTPSTIPPLAMVHRGLGYTYDPSRPTITILEGQPDKPARIGIPTTAGGSAI